VGSEERVGPEPKPGGRAFSFIRQLFRIHQSAAVINSVMQKRIPNRLFLLVLAADLAALHPMATTGRNTAQFLDINMDKVPRVVHHVTHWGD
jgi:hypothetical protein